MTWQTFVKIVRVGGREYHVLWQSQFSFDSADRLICDESDHIIVFPSATEARAYAIKRGEQVGELPASLGTLDLDAVRQWCNTPLTQPFDSGTLWRAWTLFADAGLLAIPVAIPGDADYAESESFENVMMSALAVNSPAEYNRYVRPWREGELDLIAAILGRGLDAFISCLSPAV